MKKGNILLLSILLLLVLPSFQIVGISNAKHLAHEYYLVQNNKIVKNSSFNQKWNFQTQDFVDSFPTIADINNDGDVEVIFGSWDNYIYCLDGNTGAEIWHFATEGGVASSPVLGNVDEDSEDEIIFGSNDGKLYCLDIINDSPDLKWSFSTGGKVWSTPALYDINNDGGIEIVFGSGDKNVYCIEGATGAKIWSYQTKGKVYSSPCIYDIDNDDDMEIIIGSWDRNVYCLNGHTGKKEWAFKTGLNIPYFATFFISSSPKIEDVDNDGTAEIFIGSGDHNLYCLDGATGKKKWNYKTRLFVSSIPSLADVDNDGQIEVVATSGDGSLYCIDAITGMEEWNYETGFICVSSPAIGDIDNDGRSEILFGSGNHNVYCIDGCTGEKEWSFLTGHMVHSSPTLGDIDNDGKIEILIGSDDGALYCLEDDNAEDVDYDKINYNIVTEDDFAIKLTRYLPSNKKGVPILLIHGMLGNYRVLDYDANRSLAQYLANEGWDVWLLNLRTHDGDGDRGGNREDIDKNWDFDKTYLAYDVKDSIKFVLNETESDDIVIFGHSMGGKLAIAYTEIYNQGEVAGVITTAASCIGHRASIWEKFYQKIFGIKKGSNAYVSPFAPSTLDINNIFFFREAVRKSCFHKTLTPISVQKCLVASLDDEPAGVVVDMMFGFDSKLYSGHWIDPQNGYDYTANLSKVNIPYLAISAGKDTADSPEEIEATVARIGSNDVSFVNFQEYNHLDLLLSDKAEEEVFSTISIWLEMRFN